MNGAREYAKLIKTGQYGRLYCVSGEHARGRTFRVFVLPEGENAISNGPNNAPRNRDAIEVYGITGGHPGWTESYGWLHRGPWCDDFERLVASHEMARHQREEMDRATTEEAAATERERVALLLSNYETRP